MNTWEFPSELGIILERFARQYPGDVFSKNDLRFAIVLWVDLTNATDKKKEMPAGDEPGSNMPNIGLTDIHLS